MSRNHVVVFSSKGQHPDDFEEALNPAYFGYCPQTDDGELDVDFVVHRASNGNVSIRPIGELHQDRVVIMVLGSFNGGARHSRPLTREEAEAVAEIVVQLQDRQEVEEDPQWEVDLGPSVPADQPPPVEPAPTQVGQVPTNVPENPGLGNQPDQPPQVVVPPAPSSEAKPATTPSAPDEANPPAQANPEPAVPSEPASPAPSEPSPPADGTQDVAPETGSQP